MSTSIKDGNVITVTAAGAVLIDSVQQVGDMVGIAATGAAAASDEYELATCGVYGGIPRTNIALSAGDAVYWNGTAVTATNTDRFMGHVIADYALGTTAIKVRLQQSTI